MPNNSLQIPENIIQKPQLILELREKFGSLYDEASKPIPGKEKEAEAFLERLQREVGMPVDYSVKLIGITLEEWYESIKKNTVESNILTPEQLAQWQEVAEETSTQLKESRERSAQDVGAGIKKQQEIYTKVKVDKAKLSGEEQGAAEEIVNQIKNASTEEEVKETIRTVGEVIKSRIPEEIPQSIVELTAASIVFNVRTNTTPTIQTAVVKSATEEPRYQDLAILLSDQGKTLQEQRDLILLTQNVTKLAFGEEFQKFVLPDVEVEEVSPTPSAGFTPVQIPPVYTVTPQTEEIEVVSFGQTWVQQQLSQIGEGNIQGTNYNPKLLQSSFSPFKPLTGAAKDLASNTVKKIATKTIGNVAAKTGIKAAITKLTTAVGLTGGPITAFLGWLGGTVFGKILDKINWKKLKEYSLAIAAIPVIGAGILFGIPALILAGGVMGAAGLGLGAGMTIPGMLASVGGLFGAIFTATLGAIGIPILVTLLTFPVVVALILFIINSGAYIVPPKLPDSAFTGTGVVVTCSTEKGPVGIAGPNSSSAIANRAWEITYDLYQGFWCFWNRSPGNPPHSDFPNDIVTYPDGYPNLFDYALYKTNPNPCRDCVQNLFWCTWLPIKAYEESGNPIAQNTYTPSMYSDFKARSKIIDNHDPDNGIYPDPSNVKPGAVVFFDVDNTLDRMDHVGVVYTVNEDGITFVQSNAATKDDFIPFGTVGLQDLPGIVVKAIGNP